MVRMGNTSCRQPPWFSPARNMHVQSGLGGTDRTPLGCSSKTWPSHLPVAAVIFCSHLIDAQALTGYVAHRAVFRTGNGSLLLDVVSKNQAEREQPFSRLQGRASAGP
jgi:hypothetical protein